MDIVTFPLDLGIRLYIKLIESCESIFNATIYLDNNATTKPCTDAIVAFNKNMFLGNASSLYASKCVNIIRDTKLLLLNCLQLSPDNYTVIFTSGASESINTFFNTMFQYDSNIPIITTSYEHITTLLAIKKFKNIKYVEPDVYGLISVDAINSGIVKGLNTIVNVMQTNNEIGSTNYINKCDLINSENIIYHSDIVQAFSKYPIISADAYSISFHKIYGFQGCGALVISNKLLPIFKKYTQIKGHQNDHLRGGTENIAIIASIKATLFNTFNNRPCKNYKLLQKKLLILKKLYFENPMSDFIKFYNNKSNDFTCNTAYEIVIISTNSINTIMLSVIIYSKQYDNVNKILQKKLLNKGVVVSIGSACSKGSKSQVMESMKIPNIMIKGILRVSLGDNNSFDDCYKFCNIFKSCIMSML